MTYDTAYGTPAADRRDARVDAIVARDMRKLRGYADAIRAALTALRAIGEPEVYGEIYDEMMVELEALIPETSPAAEAELRELVLDKVNAEGCF